MNIVRIAAMLSFLAASCPFLWAIEPLSWDELSDRDISPTAKLALSFQENWLHAESKHFIYHFNTPKTAETITTYAEIYYDWIKDLFKSKPKVKVTYRSEQTASSKKSAKGSAKASQEEIDAILDKISERGYESLTSDEKEKLFNASKK